MRSRCSTRFGVVVAVLTLSGPVSQAQAQSAEEAAVVQVVHDLFDGMREADADKIRGVFAEGARLGGKNREGVVNYTSIAPSEELS